MKYTVPPRTASSRKKNSSRRNGFSTIESTSRLMPDDDEEDGNEKAVADRVQFVFEHRRCREAWTAAAQRQRRMHQGSRRGRDLLATTSRPTSSTTTQRNVVWLVDSVPRATMSETFMGTNVADIEHDKHGEHSRRSSIVTIATNLPDEPKNTAIATMGRNSPAAPLANSGFAERPVQYAGILGDWQNGSERCRGQPDRDGNESGNQPHCLERPSDGERERTATTQAAPARRMTGCRSRLRSIS